MSYRYHCAMAAGLTQKVLISIHTSVKLSRHFFWCAATRIRLSCQHFSRNTHSRQRAKYSVNPFQNCLDEMDHSNFLDVRFDQEFLFWANCWYVGTACLHLHVPHPSRLRTPSTHNCFRICSLIVFLK
jgi:hypothetical protein